MLDKQITLRPFMNFSDKDLLTILFLAYFGFGISIFAFLGISVTSSF